MHFSKADWKNATDEVERQAGFERDLRQWLNRPVSDHNQRAHRRSQIDFIRNRKGEIAIEHTVRFEAIEQEFNALARRLGWKGVEMKRVGDSGRSMTYRQFYSSNARQLIEQRFGDDLRFFAYEY